MAAAQSPPPKPTSTCNLPKHLQFLLEYRWIFVLFLVLPLSKLITLLSNLRTYIYCHYFSSPQNHNQRVLRIQQQVQEATQSDNKKLFCTARPTYLQITFRRNDYKYKQNAIELPLYDVLELDTTRGILKAEPGVTVGVTTSFLVEHGWTMSVVPELDELTLGGLFMGYGIEGSSHKYGLFSDIVTECEVIVADGRLVKCSEDENQELFWALPWSHGSLGFLVSLSIKVRRCKKFVRLVYEPVESQERMVERFGQESCRGDYEFIEGLMFEKNRGVLMMGEFAEEVRKQDEKDCINCIGRWYKPWFYKHVEGLKEKRVEYIPLRDYYHRHTKSLFWEAELILPFGNDPWFRYLLGWLMPPQVSYLKLTQGQTLRDFYQSVHVVQDFLVPLRKLNECLDFGHRVYEIYPIWLCPHVVRKTEPQGFLKPPANNKDTEMYVDVGYYGTPRPVLRGKSYDAIESTQRFEKWLREHRGYQTCHAMIYQTRDEFREMYDHTLLDKVRKQYGAENRFMEVFDKVGGA